MPPKYRICIISPSGYGHSYAFAEVAVLLKVCFEELGYVCDIAVNDCKGDRVNVVLGYHLLDSFESLGGVEYIPYQLEQLSESEGVYNRKLESILENAQAVWDYSRDNIEFLAKRNINAKLLPLGYHPALENIRVAGTQDIDFLFYGSMNNRRKKVLESIGREVSGSIKTLFGVYAERRDNLIARSKIVLNIHHYSTKIFEAVRLSYLLNNGIFFITEQSEVNPYPQVDMCSVEYDSIVDMCRRFLNDEKGRFEYAASCKEQFAKYYGMSRLLSSVV